ncbi:MAG: diguanylate cyclase [Desulfobacteraceae bacterium]|nr:diguanylate cyclase [Desulfobacteraceae bacterium]
MKDKIIGLNGEFTNKRLEDNFMATTWPRQIKPVIFITAIIIAATFAVDIKKILLFNITDDFTVLLTLKATVFLSGIFLILFNLTQSLIISSSLISCVFFITTGLYLTGESVIKTDVTGTALSALVLLTFCFYFFYNFKIMLTAFGCIFSSLLFISGNYFYNGTQNTDLIIFSVILLSSNIFGFFSYLKISRLKRKAYFLENGMDKLKKDITTEKQKIEREKTENANIINIPIENNKNFEKEESFSSHLHDEFYRSRRYSNELSVLIAEINKFDKIKENLGNKTADLIADEFLKSCKKEIRPAGDYLEKTSENQFSFVLPSTDEYGAFSLAERLIEKTSKKTYKIQNKKIKITISTGIACLENEKEPLALFEHAKNALAQSKYKTTREAVFY